MLGKTIALFALGGMLAGPVAAADFRTFEPAGARQTGTALGAYLRLPLWGGRAEWRAVAGFRLSAVHDFRDGLAPNAPTVTIDALELQLGGARPTLLVAGTPVAGQRLAARSTGETVALVAGGVAAAALVGVLVLKERLDTDPGDDE